MPNITPRKTRQRHQNNSSQSHPVPAQQSDYESEHASYYTAPAPSRNRDHINFSVLRRYVPSLETVLTCAPHAQVYSLQDTETGANWDRANIEGSLFVCQLTPSPITGAQRHCLVILNRKGMENLIIEFGEIAHIEIGEDEESKKYLMLGFQSKENAYLAEMDPTQRKLQILGFFLHCDEQPSREEICELIKETWEESMREKLRIEAQDGIIEYDETLGSIERNGDQTAPMGRRLSLTDLFGQR